MYCIQAMVGNLIVVDFSCDSQTITLAFSLVFDILFPLLFLYEVVG